ncbi:hypothetical protein PTI45_03448 [Paenibacillus nuruki]|uniref:Uncharacterized protein n=1 Tax=Paenibacillus nuruki TaxID=1886670 RepID=A0A1E3L004_9BACL|nr:hypothetical protein [Paenibacillus nuruki]ODP27127.1 hypothetical protein PTI45_03448 [Paenibacillus nuruki]CAJ1315050.1 CdiI-N domain-containing protein [Paenibacillus nuruki]
MKITLINQSDLTLIYLYFYSREQCIHLNTGGEADKVCKLLFNQENEWIGLSIESNYLIRDMFEPNPQASINYINGEWIIYFTEIFGMELREEEHSCITDLYNDSYTGIELILIEGTIPKRKFIEPLIYKNQQKEK